MKLRSIFMTLIMLTTISISPPPIHSVELHTAQQVTTRAALDMGSGEIKITVADVDLLTNKIVTIWHQSKKRVPVRKDVAASPDNRLSPAIEEQVIDTILTMKENVKQFNAKEWVAVGTSVYRTAKNGQEFLDRVRRATGVVIHLLPQIEEAEIGFTTAVATSKESPDDAISWDSGSGSFQITKMLDGNLEMYGAEFAFVPALEAIFAIRHQSFNNSSPNPISKNEALELIKSIQSKLPATPQWLTNSNKSLIGIGGDAGDLFHIGSVATGKRSFTKEDIFKAISELSGKTDEQLRDQFVLPEKTIIALSLIYAIMDHCNLKEVTYFPTFGNCEGVLITPRFW